MHCDIVKLTNQLRRQIWIIRYVSIHFFVSSCGNLASNSNSDHSTYTPIAMQVKTNRKC
ncbi:hypothetical protein Hanom_Chr07g00639991 [Helianthus anomalus]